MAGQVIGKALNYGFPGTVSRASDSVIMSFPVTEGKINFGDAVAFDAATGSVKPVDGSTQSADIIGIAVREVRQPYAEGTDGWYYKVGDVCNVIVRGSVVVEVADDTGIAARGKVYAVAGGGISAAASGNVQIANTIFSTGKIDGNDVAEITILERSM